MTTGPVHPPTAASSPPRLSWPPPGMEALHGRLLGAISVLALGDLVLVLPLLLSVLPYQHFLSLGTFGGGWWVPIATSLLGALVLGVGFQRIAGLLWAAGRLARDGYGWQLILHVLADADHDAGFLIQGLRYYEGAGVGERRTVLSVRLGSVLCYAGAAVWTPFGFSLAVMLAAIGSAGPGTIWLLGVAIPLALFVAGFGGRLASGVLVRAARKRGRTVADLHGEIADWTSRLTAVGTTGAVEAGATGRGRSFRTAAILAAVVAVLAILPALGLTASGAIGGVIASLAAPKFSNTQAKLVRAEVLRDYVLESDPAVTPQAAGEALHALVMVGDTQPMPLLRTPVRTYEPWNTSVPDEGAAAQAWVMDALGRARGGLSRADRDVLRAMANHPAHAEFATVAAAEAVDVIGTRYALPFPEDMAPWELPIPRFNVVRQAAVAHLGMAALDLSEGRVPRAERAIREVISLGFVMIDDAPLLIDNLIGVVMVNVGGDALLVLYRATGRVAEADQIETLRQYVEMAGARVAAIGMGPSPETWMRAMPRIVVDTSFAPGLRWEFFGSVNAFAGCLNLHTLVFGPGEDYRAWRAEARAALVRRPSDEALFSLMSRGLFGVQGCGTPFERVRLLREFY